jgi:thiamine biosynthesis lipoprotein ApbE
VVADTCTLADALSTTLFVLGSVEGLKFIETIPNAAALFVLRTADGSVRAISSGRFCEFTGYIP